MVGKVRELGSGQGFNAATGAYGDLAAEGVLDPVKVTKAALGHAASIAAMVLTTDSAVVEAPRTTTSTAVGTTPTATRTAATATRTEEGPPPTPGHAARPGPWEGAVPAPHARRRAGRPSVVDRPFVVRVPSGQRRQTPTRTGEFSAAMSRVRSSSLMPPHTP